jgi:hypothetical protein
MVQIFKVCSDLWYRREGFATNVALFMKTGTPILHLYEAVHLVDVGSLELYFGSLPLSVQQAYNLLESNKGEGRN